MFPAGGRKNIKVWHREKASWLGAALDFGQMAPRKFLFFEWFPQFSNASFHLALENPVMAPFSKISKKLQESYCFQMLSNVGI